MKFTKLLFQFVPVSARLQLKALCLITCIALILCAGFASAQQNPIYGDQPNACENLTVGSHAFGPNPVTGEYDGALNGFLPFSANNPWNTNIAGAPLDPNNAAIQAVWAVKNPPLTRVFGTGAGQDGIDFTVIDSTNIPKVRINTIAYGTQDDNVVAPYPPDDTIKLEGEITDCDGWPHTHEVDQHTVVLDRATCWLYETGETDRCNGLYAPDSLAIWDMTNYNPRPWSWTSAQADGTVAFAGSYRYEEAASGVINHALNFTYSPELKGGSNGYYILPATHTDGTSTTSLMVMGMRIRLKATTDISSFSPINQTILTAMKNYGMILAETGSNFFLVGDTDQRWNDADLDSMMSQIHASDFEVVQMTPAFPGADAAIGPADYPVALPAISSFTASAASVSAGTPVTFNYTVSGSNWDENFTATTNAPRAYIDNIGPLRLTAPCPCSGSVTIKPTVTQEYTLYATNTTGQVASSQVIVTVPGTVVAPPVFTPPPGSYASSAALKVTLSTTSESTLPSGLTNAAFYYTTASGLGSSGATFPSTPTTASTLYSGTGTSGTSLSVSKSGGWESLCAIVKVPVYAAPSTPTCATYYFGSTSTVVDTPVFTTPGGTYTTPPMVDFRESTSNASIFVTTDGSTPVPAASNGVAPNGNPPVPPTQAYEYGTTSNCWDCTTTGPLLVSNGETVNAIAVTYSGSAIKYTSAMATATYTIVPTIAFTQSPVTYGVSPITLSATTTCPLGNPVTFTYVSGPGTLNGTNNDTLTITGAGTVKVTANQASGSLCGAATPTTANIVVNPAVLTVTANNLSKAAGAANPTLTASYSGFQYSDGTGVLSGAPALSTTATTASGAGTYPITVTQGTLSAANYTFAFVNGTLSVIAAPTVVITTTATVTGSHSGGYSVAVTVTNSGTGAASNVTLTSATLGTTNGTPVPQSVATLGAGDSYTFTVSVPGSAGLDGAGVAEKYSGTYTGGSFSASVRSVTLP